MSKHLTDATPIASEEHWRRCPFQGCSEPRIRHHHHVFRGRVDAEPCECPAGRTTRTPRNPL